jgi:hypothetical protein
MVHQVCFHYTEAFTSVVRNLSEWRWCRTVPLVSLQGRFDTEQGTSVLAQADRFVIGIVEAIISYLSCILGCPVRSFFSWFSGSAVTQAVRVSPFCHRRWLGSILGQCMWYLWWKRLHTWIDFSPCTSVLLCQYHSTPAPFLFIYHWHYIIIIIYSVVK